MTPPVTAGALAGLSVVEVVAGASELGLGGACGLPGMVLGDLGASVTLVRLAPADIDADLPWRRAWHRDKAVLQDPDAGTLGSLVAGADIVLACGPEEAVEGAGLGYRQLVAANPSVIHARCRPTRTADGVVADHGLVVEARAGFCTQLSGHRMGPIAVDVRASGTGAALVMTVGVLALLVQRERTGSGGWTETSLYDGLLSTLGCMIGRSERAEPDVEDYWRLGSTYPNFLYRCADDELLQVWFGGKGMYDALIEVLGDEPSTAGYYADQVSGRLQQRKVRWQATFATRPRAEWLERLRAAGVACEPVLDPGDLLDDEHLRAAGLVVERPHDGHVDVTVATPVQVTALDRPGGSGPPRWLSPGRRGADRSAGRGGLAGPLADRGPLAGVRVVDFSAYVAGPLAAQVLAGLGAEVVKVEPPGGEAMRAAAYAVAACQRGKRSLAVDITAPAARAVVDRLLGWADVVVHNFRVGVAERLGIDAATAITRNPAVVHCHATAFGTTGPRARYPGNDALMQALTGMERAVGGAGNEPVAATWIPIDMCGGWVGALGALAGLVAAARSGRPQQVTTSLLGAGLLLYGGVHRCGGRTVRHPSLDGGQTGYGPGHRLYRTGDGRWLAVVIPDRRAWQAVRRIVGTAMPAAYVPLRRGDDDGEAAAAEKALADTLATAPAAHWRPLLDGAGAVVAEVEEPDRDGFRRRVLDDPLNRQLGRVVGYPTQPWGWFEQIGPLVRLGPGPAPRPDLRIPEVGEDSAAVLQELGIGDDAVAALVADGVVRTRPPAR